MPHSWLDLPIADEFVTEGYTNAALIHGIPKTIEEWGRLLNMALTVTLLFKKLNNLN